MTDGISARRDAVGGTAAAGTVGLASAQAYDPRATFDLAVSDVELRRNAAGRMLMARIYRPKGPGPFPTVLDLHGGAWSRKDRLAEEPMDRALAASGLLVVAVDLTISSEAPYPACIQDANYSARWLKANAAKWNGDVSRLGVYGSSSGGHVAQLLAMLPHHPRYASIPLPDSPNVDATVSYVAMRSPVSDTFARYQNAERRKNEGMIKNNKAFFSPWETIHEGNPREVLAREKVNLPPFLIMQGALDDNVLPEMQEEFARAYRAAGGQCDYRLFEGSVHEWVAEPGPQTDKARHTVKEFIARQLRA